MFCTWSCTNPCTDVVIGPARNDSCGAFSVRTADSFPSTSSAWKTAVVISRASASWTAGSSASGETTDRYVSASATVRRAHAPGSAQGEARDRHHDGHHGGDAAQSVPLHALHALDLRLESVALGAELFGVLRVVAGRHGYPSALRSSKANTISPIPRNSAMNPTQIKISVARAG